MKKISVEILLDQKMRPTEVIQVKANDHVLNVANLMNAHNVGLVLVTDEKGALIGVVSERDIVRKCFAQERDFRQVLVKEIMSTEVEFVSVGDNLNDCFLRFVAKNCRHLPVIDATGSVVGVLSLRDVARYLVESH